jgi:peptidyl-prolyl cis-trans isomerase B (cyclophilin B)
MKSPVLSSVVGVLLGLTVQHAFAQNAPAPSNAAPPASSPAPAKEVKEVAIIKTSKGDMVLEFWSDVAPKTVENFKKLSKEGFYNGTIFHRIIKGFMIQGGDPLTKDPANEGRFGTGDPGYKIKAEFNPKKHERGVISMARSADPDSAGSQFFICLDAAPFLDGKYTTFGRLTKGEDVLLKIGETPVVPNRGEVSRPAEKVVIESITLVPAPEGASEKKP